MVTNIETDNGKSGYNAHFWQDGSGLSFVNKYNLDTVAMLSLLNARIVAVYKNASFQFFSYDAAGTPSFDRSWSYDPSQISEISYAIEVDQGTGIKFWTVGKNSSSTFFDLITVFKDTGQNSASANSALVN